MDTNSVNINDSFFSGSYRDLWKKIIPLGLTEVECDFIEEITGIEKNEKLLDIMCGYGRHALQLGRKGYKVHAIDNSEEYIAEIQAIAISEGLPVEAEVAGVLQVQLKEKYRAAIIMGNSFSFFNKTDTILLLKKITSHLQKGGICVINSYMIAEIALRHFKEKEWNAFDGYKYLLDYSFHLHPTRIESEHTIITSDGKVEVIHGIDYIFSVNELEEMFQLAGLRLMDIYATPRKRKFKMGDTVSYLVVEKAG